MINDHQPTIFGQSIIAALSSKKNGNMKFGIEDDSRVVKNREGFLQSVGIDPQDTTLVGITYATDDFTKYRTVTSKDKGDGIITPSTGEPIDALVTDMPGHALFLPVADCIGAVLYDSQHHVLMVSHLGRHSAEVEGAIKSVAYLKNNFNTDPAHLKVWLSPAVGKASYPLHKFDGQGLHEVIASQFVAAGVPPGNIEDNNVDTAAHPGYYSHSEFLKGNQTEPGRFAIVASMRAQGEPAS